MTVATRGQTCSGLVLQDDGGGHEAAVAAPHERGPRVAARFGVEPRPDPGGPGRDRRVDLPTARRSTSGSARQHPPPGRPTSVRRPVRSRQSGGRGPHPGHGTLAPAVSSPVRWAGHGRGGAGRARPRARAEAAPWRRTSPGAPRSRRGRARPTSPRPRRPRRPCAGRATGPAGSWSARSPGRAGPRCRFGEERLVELQLVDRQLTQVGERGVAGAVVVDGDPHAGLAQPVEDALGAGPVAHEEVLGDLDLERVAGRVRAARAARARDPAGRRSVREAAERLTATAMSRPSRRHSPACADRLLEHRRRQVLHETRRARPAAGRSRGRAARAPGAASGRGPRRSSCGRWPGRPWAGSAGPAAAPRSPSAAARSSRAARPRRTASVLDPVREDAEALGLRVVHRHVGLAQQGAQLGHAGRYDRDADAGLDVHGHAVDRHGLGDRAADLVRRPRRRVPASAAVSTSANSSPPRRTTRSADAGTSALQPARRRSAASRRPRGDRGCR